MKEKCCKNFRAHHSKKSNVETRITAFKKLLTSTKIESDVQKRRTDISVKFIFISLLRFEEWLLYTDSKIAVLHGRLF